MLRIQYIRTTGEALRERWPQKCRMHLQFPRKFQGVFSWLGIVSLLPSSRNSLAGCNSHDLSAKASANSDPGFSHAVICNNNLKMLPLLDCKSLTIEHRVKSQEKLVDNLSTAIARCRAFSIFTVPLYLHCSVSLVNIPARLISYSGRDIKSLNKPRITHNVRLHFHHTWSTFFFLPLAMQKGRKGKAKLFLMVEAFSNLELFICLECRRMQS